MSTSSEEHRPPPLRRLPDGEFELSSLADLLEWFLNYDERTARIRHRDVEELFQWKQQDDEQAGAGVYPFESAEARLAIGAFQALTENRTEPELKLWLTSLLEALHESRNTTSELTEAFSLDRRLDASALERAELLPTAVEKRLYLTSRWLEALCTAEIRFLGWVYQEKYGRPFQP